MPIPPPDLDEQSTKGEPYCHSTGILATSSNAGQCNPRPLRDQPARGRVRLGPAPPGLDPAEDRRAGALRGEALRHLQDPPGL